MQIRNRSKVQKLVKELELKFIDEIISCMKKF